MHRDRRLHLEAIKAVDGRRYGVSTLRKLCRHKPYVLERQRLMYILREAGFTWQAIGTYMCRDHTTVITGYRRHKKRKEPHEA